MLDKTTIHKALLTATKIAESRHLLSTDKEILPPEMRDWPFELVESALKWSSNKYNVFSEPPPVLGEWNCLPQDNNCSFSTLYRSPDSKVSHCILSNGYTDALFFVNEGTGWFLAGMFSAEGLMDRLLDFGPELVEYKQDSHSSDHSDYWDRYGEEEEEEEEEEAPRRGKVHKDTVQSHQSIHLRGYLHRHMQDLLFLYTQMGLGLDDLASDVGGGNSVLSEYTLRSLQALKLIVGDVEDEVRVALLGMGLGRLD